jgi:hypothetical protein
VDGSDFVLSIPKHNWEDNIKMGVKEIEWEAVNWVCLAQDWEQNWCAAVNTIMIWVQHMQEITWLE